MYEASGFVQQLDEASEGTMRRSQKTDTACSDHADHAANREETDFNQNSRF